MMNQLAKRYNQQSRQMNGNTTTTLRRKKGEQVDYKFQLLGVKKND